MNIDDFKELFQAQANADYFQAKLESLKSKTLSTLSEGGVDTLKGELGSVEVQLKKGRKSARTSDVLKDLNLQLEMEIEKLTLANKHEVYSLEKEIFHLEHQLREILTNETVIELEEDIQREKLRLRDQGDPDKQVLKVKLASDPILSKLDPDLLTSLVAYVKKRKRRDPGLVFNKAHLRQLVTDYLVTDEELTLIAFAEARIDDKS